MNQTMELRKILLKLQASYRDVLSDFEYKVFCDDLGDLSTLEIESAIEKYKQNPKNQKFPLAAQLVALARPGSDPQVIAKKLVEKIKKAISKKGRTWEDVLHYDNHNSLEEAVKERFGLFGDIAWRYISSRGWVSIVDEANGMDIGIFTAQTRNAIEASVSEEDLKKLTPKAIELEEALLQKLESKRLAQLEHNASPQIELDPTLDAPRSADEIMRRAQEIRDRIRSNKP